MYHDSNGRRDVPFAFSSRSPRQPAIIVTATHRCDSLSFILSDKDPPLPPPRSPLSPRAENARTFRTGPRSILVHRFCPSISLASLSRFAPASREGFHFFHINRKARRLLLFFLPAGPPPLPRYNSRGSTERILNLENAPFVLYARARSPSSLPRSSSPLLVAGPPPRADICKRRSRAAKGYAGIEANSN